MVKKGSKKRSRVCAKTQSHCTKKGLKSHLMKLSKGRIATIAGVGVRTPKTHEERTKRALVNLALKKRVHTVARHIGVKLKRKRAKRSGSHYY